MQRTALVTMPVLRMTDGVIADLTSAAARLEPEWGAALFGVGDLVTFILFDDVGETDGLSWTLSDDLRDLVPVVESLGVGQFWGTVHGHPNGVSRASSTDIDATARILRANPDRESLIVGIVSAGAAHSPGDLPLGNSHRLTSTLVSQSTGHAVGVVVETVPISAGLRDAGVASTHSATTRKMRRDPAGTLHHAPRSTGYFGRNTVVYNVAADHGLALALPSDYPRAGPLLVEIRGTDDVQIRSSPWDPARPARVQLRNLVRNALAAPETSFKDRAAPGTAGVLVVGAGAVGCSIAEDLVRAGATTVTLVDPARVGQSDIRRSSFIADDLGEWRVYALRRHLRAINPGVAVNCVAAPIALSVLSPLFDGSSLVVVTTHLTREDRSTIDALDSLVVPVVYCVADDHTALGIVALVVPGSESSRMRKSLATGERMLGTIRAQGSGSAALPPSIRVIAGVGAQLAVALLVPQQNSGTDLLSVCLESGRTVGVINGMPFSEIAVSGESEGTTLGGWWTYPS